MPYYYRRSRKSRLSLWWGLLAIPLLAGSTVLLIRFAERRAEYQETQLDAVATEQQRVYYMLQAKERGLARLEREHEDRYLQNIGWYQAEGRWHNAQGLQRSWQDESEMRAKAGREVRLRSK